MLSQSHTYSSPGATEKRKAPGGRFFTFLKSVESAYFGCVSMFILVGSCVGSITVMQVFRNYAGLWQLVVCVCVTVANLIACILQLSARWILVFFMTSVFVNVFLLLISFF